MNRLVVQLTDEQLAALRELARREKVSIAEIVRQSVSQRMRGNIVLSREERVRRALAVAGRYASGRGDVSKNHDRELAEAYKK